MPTLIPTTVRWDPSSTRSAPPATDIPPKRNRIDHENIRAGRPGHRREPGDRACRGGRLRRRSDAAGDGGRGAAGPGFGPGTAQQRTTKPPKLEIEVAGMLVEDIPCAEMVMFGKPAWLVLVPKPLVIE